MRWTRTITFQNLQTPVFYAYSHFILPSSSFMHLSIGIVGLPNVGKSTLFKTLTSQEILIANYEFATIDKNVGIVAVPDERLQVLSKMSNSAKTIPAVVEFYDIAGLVKGAATEGAGLGNKFLSHIRETNAIVQVVRCFSNPEIIRNQHSTDPATDIDIINTELALKDLDTITKRIPKAESDSHRPGKEGVDAKKEVEVLRQIEEKLSQGQSLLDFSDNEVVKNLALLSAKPKFYLLNGKEEDVGQEVKDKIAQEGNDFVIADLSNPETIPDVIKKAYEILGLISFFTTGEDETRAWTIVKDSSAPVAAGAIHTDFQNKFIRAEVVGYTDFVATGGWSQSRQTGKLRVEGKEYIVKDGDILVIRHAP